jgi:hypothetical protein
MQSANESGLDKDFPPMELDYDLIIKAVISEINKKTGAIEEDMVINTLKTRKIEK